MDDAGAFNSQWHVFNDFLVKPISEDEALGFAGSWKVRKIPHVPIFAELGDPDPRHLILSESGCG